MTHKYSKPLKGNQPGRTVPTGCGTVFRDTNPAAKDPFKEQFAPTDEYPIQQRHRMGGVS